MSGAGKDIRAERLLDRYGATVGLTEQGRNWLIPALDPFHDTLMDYQGFPDLTQSAAIPQCIKLTMTISAPSTADGGNWDCHLVDLPWVNTLTMGIAIPSSSDPYWKTSYMATGQGTHQFQCGGLTAITVPTGIDTNPEYSSVPVVLNLSIPDNYTTGNFRCVAKGFEVHNVTPELYKGGSVLVYRMSQPSPDDATVRQANNANTGLLSSPLVLANDIWPTNVATAQLMPGSRQWDAAAGCYVTSALNTTNIDIQRDNFIQPLLYDYVEPGVPGYNNVSLFPTPTTIGGSIDSYIKPVWTNFDIGGAYFSGLNTNTVLTVNWNVYIERFPTYAQGDLAVLAKRPPKYDPIALQMYSAIVQSLPVGVPVAENGLGDWFKSAISNVVDFVQPIASAVATVIPHPAAQAVAAGFNAAKGQTDTWKTPEVAVPMAPPLTPANTYSNQPLARLPQRAPKMSVPVPPRPRARRAKPALGISQAELQAAVRRRRQRQTVASNFIGPLREGQSRRRRR